MNIRTAVSGDAAGIARVHVTSWRQTYRGLMPEEYLAGLDVDERTRAWKNWLAALEWPRSGVFVATDGQSVCGFAHFAPSRDEDADGSTAELTSIYLLSEKWQKGAGRALLDEVASTWRLAGYAQATLWVLGANTRARAFYERCGWTPDGKSRKDNTRGFPLDEIRYKMRTTNVTL